MKISAAVVAVLAIVAATPCLASQKFGLLFDVQGGAEIRQGGKVLKLERERHILLPVREGDRLKTGDTGKVVVVSLRDKTGYELGPATEAVVDGVQVRALRGTVKTHKGYSASVGVPGGPIGAIVLRGPADERAVRIVSPSKTRILTETPELKWHSSCANQPASVTLSEGDRVILRKEVSQSTLAVPDGVLAKGHTYSWGVESSCGKSRSSFEIPPAEELTRLDGEMARRKAEAKDLPGRLSYVFFLIDSNLRDSARAELESLQQEYPLNRFLKEL